MNARYRLVWLAYFLSGAGDWITRLAVPVMLYHLTGSALYLSLAYAMTYLPFLLITPAGGVFADAMDRRSLLVASDAAAGLMVVALALTAATPSTPWLFFPLLFMVFSFSAMYHPIFQSYIPSLVSDQELDKANAYLSVADNLVDVLGPVAGGLLVGLLGAPNALWLDAGSFFISAFCLYLVARDRLVFRFCRDVSLRSLVSDFREGAVYVFRQRVLRYCCLLFAVTNLGLTIFTANLMFFLLDRLALDSAEVGVTLGLAGIGAIAGSLAAPFVGRHVGAGILIVIATVISGLGIVLLLWFRHPLLVAALWGGVLATNSIVVVTFFTLRQRIVPTELLGRAVATSRFISFLAIPIGSLLGGWLVEHGGGIDMAILVGGMLVAVSGFMGMLMPLNDRDARQQLPI